MKKTDCFALLYVLVYTGTVFFFPFTIRPDGSFGMMENAFSFSDCLTHFTGLKNFGTTVGAYPYLSGFLKVALLATFGEMLKIRGKTSSWKTPSLVPKFLVWGLYGILFTYVFQMFATGVGALMGSPLWPVGAPPSPDMTFGRTLLFAFSTSLWMNLIFCYPMMLSHEWFNIVIAEKRFVGGSEFLGRLDPHVWGSFMLKTILFFWIPAHTVTFCLPGNYRVLMSAILSLALGFILTVKPKRKPAAAGGSAA